LTKNGYGVKYVLPAFLWMLIIFVSSSIPQDAFPKIEFWGWAKLVHLIYYGVLCFLVQRALSHQQRFPVLARHSYLLGLVFAFFYGSTDELHQLSTPGRHGQFTDVLIDTFGASLFLFGVWASRFLKLRSEVSK